jgi:hypothetical protein
MTKWIEQIFEAKIVNKEGIVRRNKTDVHSHASLDELLDYTRENGWHLIETGNQYVVLCHPGAMKIHC